MSSTVRGRPSAEVLGTAALLLALSVLAMALLLLQSQGVPTWRDPGPQRLLWAAAVVLGYGLICVGIGWGHRQRQRRNGLALQVLPAADAQTRVLVAFASQTGFAEQLAWRTAEALQSGDLPVRVMTLGELDLRTLTDCNRVLFVVSTTGEGDAPDSCARFTRLMAQPRPLPKLQYGVLALGDSSYTNYCAFGRALDHWLRESGARALFDTVEVDDGDDGALRHWQHHLGLLSGHTDLPDWRAPRYQRWRLQARAQLNPGSFGGAVFHLHLQRMKYESAAAGATQDHGWQPGDIAEIGPRNPLAQVRALLARLALDAEAIVNGDDGQQLTLAQALMDRSLPRAAAAETELQALRGLSPQAVCDQLPPLAHREYSIASLPEDGALELVVRQMAHPNGDLGLGSGWLTAYAQPGDEVRLRIRENRGFHPPPEHCPLILIGNGTGLAGLRAHLKARAAAGAHRNWLLFGERSAAADYLFKDEIEAWQASGVLQRLDLAFSRDQAERIYVQQRVQDSAEALRCWVADGAAIYVCGSLKGMAPGVHAALIAALGAEMVESLLEQGRYRRDVY